MESARFSSKKPLGVNELYAKWSKNLTHYCLPLLGESILTDPSAVLPDTDVENVVYYLIKPLRNPKHLSRYNNDTIHNILFPTGNETQLFFIGDIHPCLFTSLIRSLIDSTWRDEQVRRIDQIERGMMVATEASSSVAAVDEAAKEETEELVRIFSAANSLRKSVLREVFKATTGIQAAKFLESLCEFLAGFQDQNCPPLDTPEPSQSHGLEQQHTSEADEARERTLWIGAVTDDMDTEFLYRCFAGTTGEVVNVGLPNHKVTGKSIGYGFIEFISRDAAERALQTYNKTLVPGLVPPRRFKLRWAMKQTIRESTESIFVGDLADDVTDRMLLKTFRDHGYSSAVSAAVSTDRSTGRSRGYGFVRFSDHDQMLLAIESMNGVECSSRPMRIGPTGGN
ncbi:protein INAPERTURATE POLLEN1-like [Raphanus sativus]|nr:protein INAPERTURATE POLLEN1-like [Raphanus sativus]